MARLLATDPDAAHGARLTGVACAIMSCYLLDVLAEILADLDRLDREHPERIAAVRLSAPIVPAQITRALIAREAVELREALDAARSAVTTIRVTPAEVPA